MQHGDDAATNLYNTLYEDLFVINIINKSVLMNDFSEGNKGTGGERVVTDNVYVEVTQDAILLRRSTMHRTIRMS